MTRRRYQRSKFTSWCAGDAMHVASLLVTAAERLRAAARAKRLPRIRSAEELRAAAVLAGWPPQLVGLANIIWGVYIDRDSAEDES